MDSYDKLPDAELIPAGDLSKKFLDLGYSVKSTGPEENGMGTYLFFKD